MPVDSSAVQIVINVTDANSGEVIAQLERSLNSAGAAGASSGDKVAAGMDKMGKHSLTALDNVRLLRDDLGVRIPRSMEKAIASSQAMMTVIGGIGKGLLAIGAIDIGIRIAEGLKHVWDGYLSLTSAAEKYNEEAQKAKDEDFGNTRSIEDTRLRIDDATKAMKNFNAAAQELSGGGFWSQVGGFVSNPQQFITNRLIAKQLTDQAEKNHGQIDKLTPRQVEQQHQQNIQQIEYNHALDGSLRGHAKITAELAKQREINAENRRSNTEMDKAKGNPVAADSGAAEERMKNGIAQRQADAQTFNLQREHTQELQRLRQEAVQSGLRGNALYAAQEAAAIENLKNKDMDSVAARAAIHEKFHNEEMKRLQDEARETQQIQAEAAAAGLKGIGKTQAEGDIEIGKIRGNDNLSDEAKDARVAAARQQTNQQILQQEQEFGRNVDQIADASAAHQVSGFARIHAEASKQLDDLQRKFQETYGQIDRSTPGGEAVYKQGLAQLGRGQSAVNAGAGQQEEDLARKNADETAQIEAEARAKSLSAEKQKTAAIETEYEARLKKYQEQLQQQEISEDDYSRRVLAAQQQRNAEMIAEQEATRQKLAGELAGFFKNPLDALKNFGDKAAGQAGASIIQGLQNHFSRNTGDGGTGTGILGGIFDHIAGTPHAPGGRAGRLPSVAGGASSTLSVASAMIQVGSASISFGGFAGGAARGGAGTFGAAGAGAINAGGGSATSFGGGFSAGGSTIGGAGSSSAGAVSGGFTGTGSAPSSGSGAAGVLGNINQGISTAKGLQSIFKGSKGGSGSDSDSGTLDTTQPDIPGTLNADGTYTSAPGASGTASGAGNAFDKASGLFGDAMGLYGAFESKGGFGGAAQGALSGAKLGADLGGPIGAAIGAAGGAVLGAIGFGGRNAAHLYDIKQVRPQMKNDLDAYNQGSMDYLTAYTDIETLMTDAKNQTNKMGSGAQGYYQDTIKKELNDALGQLSREQRAGRSQYGVSAAQYAVGTDSVPRDGFAFIHEGERIMPSDQNERITSAIENGSMASAGPRYMPADTGSGDTHLHLSAIDAKSSMQFLMANKHSIRKAMNASYGEDSGGADA
ncbi:hypothetical protein H7849_11945 [Alloacidobacterium dinghuense]|uniref:Uncharacterized protein n=1 Tax=Alloacidobacterium dinghuense TaxID=2763107 RepID=A0A7G8BPR8_9BACT|nr:hypothetical protein [Alloacidobacterium dinghuense]QNI34538.1 hypothetical protein H7849_11945 [Alloacidobacterium dinghuense]